VNSEGLIVCSDRKLFHELDAVFSARAISLSHAQDWTASEELIRLESPDFLVLTGADAGEVQPYVEAWAVNEVYRAIPVICVIGRSPVEERELLWQKGVRDIIELPVLKELLELRLQGFAVSFEHREDKLADEGMRGRLDEYGPVKLLQSLGGRTAVVDLTMDGQHGSVYLVDGQIYDASYKKFEGMNAVLNLVTWDHGSFTVLFREGKRERKIELNTEQVLNEAEIRISQRAQKIEKLPQADETLLISPFVDLDLLDSGEREFVRFFSGGNTLRQFVYQHNHDEIELLDIMLGMREKGHVMNRGEFDSQKIEVESEISEGGIGGMFKRLFRKKERVPVHQRKKLVIKDDSGPEEVGEPAVQEITEIEDAVGFEPLPRDLVHFKKKLAEL
jgi:DNA-binding response OmpR family regulator